MRVRTAVSQATPTLSRARAATAGYDCGVWAACCSKHTKSSSLRACRCASSRSSSLSRLTTKLWSPCRLRRVSCVAVDRASGRRSKRLNPRSRLRSPAVQQEGTVGRTKGAACSAIFRGQGKIGCSCKEEQIAITVGGHALQLRQCLQLHRSAQPQSFRIARCRIAQLLTFPAGPLRQV